MKDERIVPSARKDGAEFMKKMEPPRGLRNGGTSLRNDSIMSSERKVTMKVIKVDLRKLDLSSGRVSGAT